MWLGRRAGGIYGSAASRQAALAGANVFNIFVAGYSIAQTKWSTDRTRCAVTGRVCWRTIIRRNVKLRSRHPDDRLC